MVIFSFLLRDHIRNLKKNTPTSIKINVILNFA